MVLAFASGRFRGLVVERRQLSYLEAASAGGGANRDFVALFAAHQAAAHGRGRRR